MREKKMNKEEKLEIIREILKAANYVVVVKVKLQTKSDFINLKRGFLYEKFNY